MIPNVYMHVITFFTLLPFLVFSIPDPVSTDHSSLVLISYAIVCVVGVVAQLVQSRGFQTGPPAKTTTVLMTHTLMSGVVGVIFFSESISWLSGLGALLIVMSVILVLVSRSKDKMPEVRYQPMLSTGGEEQNDQRGF